MVAQFLKWIPINHKNKQKNKHKNKKNLYCKDINKSNLFLKTANLWLCLLKIDRSTKIAESSGIKTTCFTEPSNASFNRFFITESYSVVFSFVNQKNLRKFELFESSFLKNWVYPLFLILNQEFSIFLKWYWKSWQELTHEAQK